MAVRERGPGKYEVVVEAGIEQGRRRQISRTFRGTELEAMRFEEQLRRDARRGRLLPRDLDAPSSRTVGQLLEEWFAIASPGWSPATARQTRSIIDGRLVDLRSTRLSQLRPHAIDRFYAGLTARGLKPSTVRRIHGVLHRSLVYAERWDWVESNPAAKVEPPPLEEDEIVLPSFEGVRKMLTDMAEHDETFGLFLRLAATTAARRGELSALRWGAWNGDYIVITHALVDAGPGQGVIEKGVKTKRKGNRLVGLTPATIEALRQHRLRCAEWG
jgi:integrase